MVKQSFDRRSPSRKIRQKVLIVCEGEKTEPLYFKGIRNDQRIQTLKIQIYPAGKTDPLGIIKCAIAERKNIRADDGWESGDSVWAVLDGDEHIHNQLSLHSNPCCSKLPELVKVLLDI